MIASRYELFSAFMNVIQYIIITSSSHDSRPLSDELRENLYIMEQVNLRRSRLLAIVGIDSSGS